MSAAAVGTSCKLLTAPAFVPAPRQLPRRRQGIISQAKSSHTRHSLGWQSCRAGAPLAILATGHALTRSWQRSRSSAVKQSSKVGLHAVAEQWTSLEGEAKSTDAGVRFVQVKIDREKGVAPHTDAKIRYFGEGREKPRVTLFRDQAAWCPYCQKVWLLLEEKGVDYEIVKVPMRSYGEKPDSFLKLVPRGILPAIEIDGRLMTESLDIMFTIEGTFPNPERPMFPPAGPEREQASALLRLERELFGAWCSYLFRPEMPFIGSSDSDFTAALEAIDKELGRDSKSAFFLPYNHPTIVDMQYVSHVERAIASAMYYKGYDIRKRFANIDRWLAAYEELPHYMASKSDYYTHCMDIPPQYGACFPNESEIALRARDYIDPTKAQLPVTWQSSLEPPTTLQLQTPEEDYKVEAALSLIQNHDAVARFCGRAAGGDVGSWARGNPTKCELSDPFARPNEAFLSVVDAVLCTVAAAVLRGSTAAAAAEAARAAVDPDTRNQASECLAYLRDRIGSPRDMSMPAAKFLRAYLGEAVKALRT